MLRIELRNVPVDSIVQDKLEATVRVQGASEVLGQYLSDERLTEGLNKSALRVTGCFRLLASSSGQVTVSSTARM
jgi:hypothetical protein